MGAATSELQAVNKQVKGTQGAIDQLNGQVASTQAELDKTFVLNFGKKGELKDEIKGLKKDAAAKSKELNKLLTAQDKATGAPGAVLSVRPRCSHHLRPSALPSPRYTSSPRSTL